MVQPTDYRMNYVDPAQAMMQGMQGAQTMQANRQTMQVNDQAIQENQYKLADMQRQQQQALARKAAYDARRTELLDDANETDYLRNAVRLRSEFPEFNAGADAALKEMGETRRQQTYQTAMQVRSLVSAKKFDAAKDLLMQRAAALRNSGDEQNAKATEALAQAMIDSPDLVPQIAANIAAMTMSPADAANFLKGEAEAGKVGSEITKNLADANKTTVEAGEVSANAASVRATALAEVQNKQEYNRIALMNAQNQQERTAIMQQDVRLKQEANQLQRDQWLATMSTLPAALQPKMTEYVEEATDQASLANRAETLAVKFAEFGKTGDGKQFRTVAEWLRRSTGNQNEYTQARQQYMEVKTKAVGEMLKDFKPASNSDMDLVTKPFPDENSPPEYLSQYLASMGRVARMAATVAESKAEWLQSNRGMGKTARPIDVMGASIPAGVTYAEFRSKYLPAIVDSRNGQGGATTGDQPAAPPTASYMQLVK